MKRAKEFGFLTMVFLVLLRLSIGWHFFYEGAHKLLSFLPGETTTNKPFSSAGYFREAPGPLAWEMRKHIGDPDDEALDRLTVKDPLAGEDQPSKRYLRTPPGLQKEWEDYLKQFADGYQLDDMQRNLARINMDQAESGVVEWLTMKWNPALQRQAPDDDELKRLEELNKKNPNDAGVKDELNRLQELKKLEDRGDVKAVEKASPSGGNSTVQVLETPAERVEEYRSKVQEYRAMLDQTDAALGADVVGAKRLAAKADAATMRASLMADLDKKTEDFKESLMSLLTPEQLQKDVAFPPPPTPLIWWIDGITAWGLAIVGGCLLIGLLSRLNCLLAAGFLLMTYLASPPWPWLPTPPNNEGNYLYVNKNVVEMFALLALATTASGRWFGVDALIHWTLGALFGRKAPQPAPVRRAA